MTSARVNAVRPQPPPQTSTRNVFNGVEVFSATMWQQRNALGERVTEWLAQHPTCRVCDFAVRQSSDIAFHCLTIVVFYRDLSIDSGAQT